jgi:hypothetical protein
MGAERLPETEEQCGREQEEQAGGEAPGCLPVVLGR